MAIQSTISSLVGQLSGLIPFTLAVLSVPVFDTLRVMSARVRRHVSPFHPDKTHLHHLFIEMGNSHIVTTFLVLTCNALVVLLWACAACRGMSPEGQVWLVTLAGLFFTWGVYGGVRLLQRRAPEAFRSLVAFNLRTRPRRDGVFRTIQQVIDRL